MQNLLCHKNCAFPRKKWTFRSCYILCFELLYFGFELVSNQPNCYIRPIFQSESNGSFMHLPNFHQVTVKKGADPNFPFSWIEQNASTSVKNLKHYKRHRRPKRLTTSLKVAKKISWPFSNQKTRWWKRLDLCPSSRMKSKSNQLVQETIIFLLWQLPMLTSNNISKMISR